MTHDVIDKYERGPGVKNRDVARLPTLKKYRLIVSISTLEHVGWDESPRDPKKLFRALARLKALLATGGEMIVTVPLGYNPALDEYLRRGRLGFTNVRYLKRVSASNRWCEVDAAAVRNVRFGAPYMCANGLAIGIFAKKRGSKRD